MTVSVFDTRVVFAGAGSVGPYTFPFKIIDEDDLIVIKRDALWTEVVLTKDVDYTVTYVAGATSGTITLDTALATGYSLCVMRATEQLQEADYVEHDPFSADTHETALDKLLMQVQELNEKVGRCIQYKRSGTIKDDFFPKPVATYLLGWNSAGTGITHYAPSGSGGSGGTDRWVFIEDYDDSLETAITTINTAEVTLVIDKAVTVTTTPLIIPSNIDLIFTSSGELVGTGTIDINGNIQASPRQIFNGITVTFGGNRTTDVLIDWFGTTATSFMAAWDSIETGSVHGTPGATYTGNVTLAEATYKKILDGHFCQIDGNFLVQKSKNCQYKNLVVGGMMANYGTYSSDWENITCHKLGSDFSPNDSDADMMGHYFLITNADPTAVSNYGTYWNRYKNIRCHGVIIYPSLYVSGGCNVSLFENCRLQGAVSNSAGDHTDTFGAGLRIAYPDTTSKAQACYLLNCDLSDNAYAIYNASPWTVGVVGYIEQLDVTPIFYGSVDILPPSYVVDTAWSIPFNFDNIFSTGVRGRTGVHWHGFNDLYGNPGFHETTEYTTDAGATTFVPRGVDGGTWGSYGVMNMVVDPDGNGTGNPYLRVLKATGSVYGANQGIATMTYDAVTLKITVVTSAAHGYLNNWVVKISGANESGYNGEYKITYVDTTTFMVDPYANNFHTPSPPTILTATGTLLVQGDRQCSVRFTGSKPTRPDRATAMMVVKGAFHGSKVNGGATATYNCMNGVVSLTEWSVLVGRGGDLDVTDASWAELQLWPGDTIYIAEVVLGVGSNISATPVMRPSYRTAYSDTAGPPTVGAWKHYDTVFYRPTTAGTDIGFRCNTGGDYLLGETPAFVSLGQQGMRTLTSAADPNGSVTALRDAELAKVVYGGNTSYWLSGSLGGTVWYKITA